MDRFEVTGSNLPSAADALDRPLTVWGRAEIEQSGVAQSVYDFLRKRLPSLVGNGNWGLTNANILNAQTLSGSQISLRNLNTLVLINGRRVAANGAAARGGRSFVDLSMVPLAAIERIEVVSDGASAVYGSDAVGGVVNVVLRRQTRGGEVVTRAGFAREGYREFAASAVVGAEDSHLSLTVALSWNRSDPVLQAERPVSSTLPVRSAVLSGFIGNASLAPGVNAPREKVPTGLLAQADTLVDLIAAGVYVQEANPIQYRNYHPADYVTLLLGDEQRTASANFNYTLGPRTEWFGDLLLTERGTTSQLAGTPISGVPVPAWSPFNPLRVAILSATARFLDFPRSVQNDADFARVTGGLRGRGWGEWTWEVAGVYNRARVTNRTTHLVDYYNLVRAVAGGYLADGTPSVGGAYSRVMSSEASGGSGFVIQPALDLLAQGSAVNPASLRGMFGTAQGVLGSTLKTIDARAGGPLATLPAGEVTLAAGASLASDRLTGMPDEFTRRSGPLGGNLLGIALYDPFDRGRTITSGYAEVRVPVAGPGWRKTGLHRLDFTAAYRVDHYGDAGTARVPKVGLAWQPVDDQLTLRATYSESFTAPTLYELFGPSLSGAVPSDALLAVFGTSAIPNQAVSGSNPNLRPTTTQSRQVGLVCSPRAWPRLTVTVDYFEIASSDLIGSYGSRAILQSVEALGAASPFVSQVTLVSGGGAAPMTMSLPHELTARVNGGAPFGTLVVRDNSVNVFRQRQRALDLAARYRWPSAQGGTWELDASAQVLLSHQYQIVLDQPFFEYAGRTSNGGSGSQGTLPRLCAQGTVGWERGGWGVTAGCRHLSSVEDVGTGALAFALNPSAPLARVASYTEWDLQWRRRWSFPGRAKGSEPRSCTLTAGVNNLFDRSPPRAPSWTESNADVAAYGALGRSVYLQWAFAY